jgi:hypothetical protein
MVAMTNAPLSQPGDSGFISIVSFNIQSGHNESVGGQFRVSFENKIIYERHPHSIFEWLQGRHFDCADALTRMDLGNTVALLWLLN